MYAQGGEGIKKIGSILRQRREELGFSQDEVAKALGVSREGLVQWEKGERLPPTLHLKWLTQIYGIDERRLLKGELEYRNGLEVLLPDPESVSLPPEARLQLKRWLEFLDAYADFLEGEGEPLPRQTPLGDLRFHGGLLTDLRQASTEAIRIRGRLDLGQDALPDLLTLLDSLGVLVFRTFLTRGVPDRTGDPDRNSNPILWGAFYRHPRLGPTVLVNTGSTRGRQVFTLAHEFAHALYHSQLPGILCRREVLLSEEREVEAFANAWAAHFLVPGKALREQVRKLRKLSPEDVLFLVHYFGVSYTFLLIRLRNERLISEESFREWAETSPQALARGVGLPSELFQAPNPSVESDLASFPPSVLRRVRNAVYVGRLSVSEASGLLDVDSTTLERELLHRPRGADTKELEELIEELSFYTPGRKPRPMGA